jgi:hypothetical protein
MCYVQHKAWGSCVFIKKLRPGERAPDIADRISIDRLTDGRISWTGAVYVGGKTAIGASSGDFATIQEAESDAIAWARGQGATELQIEGPNN